MNPHTAQWLVDHAPWAVPIVVGFFLCGSLVWLATEGRGLWKYGPRWWRVTRKRDLSQFKKERENER
ncbi:hypothetical protein [Tabrizicola sp. M-4]|uniref:hypothetical protein n=1 Tax=Tabrizicola sp. M-4 TaxID=3055847 RepID=UPI003DA81597